MTTVPHYSSMAVVGRLQPGAVGHLARFGVVTEDGPYGQPRARGAVFARCAPWSADEDDPTPAPPEAACFSAGWALHLGATPCTTCYPTSTKEQA